MLAIARACEASAIDIVRRDARGGWPKCLRYAREKCAASLNPHRSPISVIENIDIAGSASNCRARSRRRVQISAAGV